MRVEAIPAHRHAISIGFVALLVGSVLALLQSRAVAEGVTDEYRAGPDWIWDLQTEDPNVQHTGTLRALVFDLEEIDGRVYAGGKFLEAVVGATMEVTWIPAADDAGDSAVIRRSRNGGTAYWSSRVAAPIMTWTDSNASAGNDYSYSVESRLGGQSSVAVVCDPVPVAP